MAKSILAVLIGKRKDTAVNVQKILTGWGCIIKTRLGIHDGILDDCSETGLIIMELVGSEEQNEELSRKLQVLDDVNAQLIHLSLPSA
jgi:hypothetical protein